MNILGIVLIFILGLIIGSFLNAVIWRWRYKKSFISGRSICPKCKHKLGFFDLLPLISFIFLRGRCGYCGKKIDWQYPLVELATGLGFVWIFIERQLIASILIFYLIIFCFLIVIFVYDLRYGLILDRLSLPAIIIAGSGNLILGAAWWSLLIGAAIGGGLFLGQFLLSKGKWVGGGDIRLGILMGLLLGWEKVLLALFLAYLSGAVLVIILLILKKKKINDSLVFGPFLTVATFITLLYGDQIINFYLSLFL